MHEAIKRAEILRSPLCPYLGKATTYDEMLIRAHLATSTVSLHVRRTLDQSFYHNIDTESRDQDQVVYRYQLKGTSIDESEIDPKIVMVDQLWMWVLGKDLIVTSFPQRWQQPKNDPLNVLDNVIEDINSKTREPVTSVYDLAMVITSRCTGVFDRQRLGDEEYQFLDMFESSIGSATDRETMLFKEFNTASAQASAWLQHHRRPNRFSRYLFKDEKREAHPTKNHNVPEEILHGPPLFVDKLLDIGQETDLLAETKDIRDELNMIAKVLSDQQSVLPSLLDSITDIFRSASPALPQFEIKKRFKDQLKAIELHLKDIERMDRQAQRIYKSITDMLDLKQKHANAFEARFARDSAAGTARQGKTIMVFTIVTIIFLPLSFIAAFFAINVAEFPRDSTSGNTNLPLGYVSKYMFGIGFAVSIPLIVIALSLDDIGGAWRHFKSRLRQKLWRKERRSGEWGQGAGLGQGSLDVLRMQEALSVARSGRKSVETEWIREQLSTSAGRPGTAGSAVQRRDMEREKRDREKITGFRMRISADIERGLGVERR
jgi:Mg2+ and Co2+ transporter CorA